ncbi:MAG: SDR family oxidoreductase [Planctomycetota bacterium]
MALSKQFLIVGGSSGIGLETVRRLHANGSAVKVVSRTWSHGDELPTVEHVTADVTRDDLSTIEFPPSLDGLVYCPGSIALRSFRGLKPEQFRQDFEVNVIGAVRIIQAALKSLRASDGASVVLFSTVAVQTGLPLHASVAAAKAGVEGLMRTLAAELSPSVRVNCIAPALVNTPLASQFFGDPEKEKAMAARYPLARTGEPSDIASMVEFLLSDGHWITGQTIGIDGGMGTIRK